MVEIQFLWWAECPSHEEAWSRLQKIVAELAPDAAVTRIEVRTDEDAERWHFPGSPTIRVNGMDIDPDVPGIARLTCRLYFKGDGRPTPLPPASIIRRALADAVQSETDN